VSPSHVLSQSHKSKYNVHINKMVGNKLSLGRLSPLSLSASAKLPTNVSLTVISLISERLSPGLGHVTLTSRDSPTPSAELVVVVVFISVFPPPVTSG
jgi:hypothetical protein